MSNKSNYFLKIRYAPEKTFASVWLLHRHGAADECLLFGEITVERAEHLAADLGLPVEREKWLLPNLVPMTVPEPGQQELFPAE